jgi:hypothetical protein
VRGQPSPGQEFAGGGKVPAREESRRGAAAQIEDDAMPLSVGGQESAEWDLKPTVLVNRAGHAMPGRHGQVGVQHAGPHRHDAVSQRVNGHVANSHGPSSVGRSSRSVEH